MNCIDQKAFEKLKYDIHAVAVNLELTIEFKDEIEFVVIQIPPQQNTNALVFRKQIKSLVVEFCRCYSEDIGVIIEDDINEEKCSF